MLQQQVYTQEESPITYKAISYYRAVSCKGIITKDKCSFCFKLSGSWETYGFIFGTHLLASL